MVKFVFFLVALLWSSEGHSKNKSREIVEEIQHQSRKEFCSKESVKAARKQCEAWISQQKKQLGERVLTTWCSERQSGDLKGCLHRVEGEITYFLKKVTRDTGDSE